MSSPTPDRPARRPVRPDQLPRRVLLAFSIGAALLVAAVALVVLSLAGVDQLSSLGFVAIVVVAAVGGGLIARVLVPRLPVRDATDPPRS